QSEAVLIHPNLLRASVLAICVAATYGPAPAAILAPGAVAEDFFTSLADRPELGGQVIASKTIPLTLRGSDGSAVYSLNLINEVVESPGGGLNFSYRILNGPEHVLGIDRL